MGEPPAMGKDFVAAVDRAITSDPCGPRFRIEDVYPSVDHGRYAVKRIVGESLEIWADIIGDGHDIIAAAVRWRRDGSTQWQNEPMRLHGNDRWTSIITPQETGRYVFQIEAWSDRFSSWRKGFLLKQGAGQDVSVDAHEGAQLICDLLPRNRADKSVVKAAIAAFEATGQADALLSPDVAHSMGRSHMRPDVSRGPVMPLMIERPLARAGAWYEMVPRSQSTVPGQHGTFDDCIARVPEIAALGFDVLYLTPIHPIGVAHRKGKNNALKAEPGDPGSFYAIGGTSGGHDAVHPQLGTLDDFRRLVAACRAHDMEVALDIAVQCSPDHPWLKQHPEWFRTRPDGTIKYAENPPKKYEDIVNPDFASDHRTALWAALRDVFLFWVNQGVEIFRVDNPHTKPLPFWEWVIGEVHRHNSDVLFLSEAFTRPKVMKALAKLGFSQSYSYFTWRTAKAELQDYLSELTRHPERDYFRPNFFVTTPDILPVQLQTGETWLFKARAALAASLSSNYGIYNGFELIEHEPIPGKEEYLNSEKYEIKTRDWHRAGNISDYLGRLNRFRRSNSALLQTSNLRFLDIQDDHLIGFIKTSVDGSNSVAGAIALSPQAREFWLHFGDARLGSGEPVRAIENLATGERRLLEWGGVRLWIDPSNDPAMLFRCLA